jgi:hypothetical protein
MAGGAAIAGTFGAITASFAYPIKAAGDLMETTSKFEAVFGDSADSVKAWADDYASAVGRSKSETMTALATFQAFFSGLGMGGDEATELSKKMASLGVDFASFHNLQDPEAMQRFISALSGSGEVLDMFGINIKQAALDQKLLAMGFPSVAKGATEVQKVMARMSIIEESMGRQGAVGDAIKTAGSFSNQLKALKASVQNTAESIGMALLPVVTPMLTKLAEVTKVIANLAQKNAALIPTIAGVIAGIAVAGAGVAAFGAALYAAGTVVGFLLTPLGAVVGVVVALSAGLAIGVTAWVKYTESGQAALQGLIDFAAPIIDTLKTSLAGIWDALKAGDLALAGKIAMKGFQLAVLQGVSAISSLLGGEGGDTFATLGHKLFSGDFAGAFQTALKQMTKWAADFSEGLVAIFTVGARKATELWQGAVNSITDFLLDASAKGGAVGKVASSVLGVDMNDQQANAQLLEQQRQSVVRRNLEKSLAQMQSDLAAAEASGDTGRADELRRGIANQQADLEKLGAAGPVDVVADAKNAAREMTKGLADSFLAKLDAIDTAMQERSANAADALNQDTAGGADKLREAMNALRDELKELTKRESDARAKIEQAKAEGEEEVEKKKKGLDEEVKTTGVAVTSSASSLVALGRGGGLGTMVKAIKDQHETQKKQLHEEKELVKETRKFRESLAFGQ